MSFSTNSRWLLSTLLILLFTSASVFAQEPRLLVPGVPISDRVLLSSYSYFKVALPTNEQQTLTITVTPLGEGDPDLYVSLTDVHPTSSAPYIATDYGQDSVTVPATAFGTNAYAYAAVYGWRNTSFTIVASFESEITLVDGIPQSGTVNYESLDYFSFLATTGHKDLTVIATALRGDIAIYIGANVHPTPSTPATITWFTDGSSSDPLVIYANDPNWPANGQFFIGVYGLSTGEAAYSLVAAMSNTHIVLRSGIPQTDHAEAGEYEYFQANVDGEGCTLTIGVTPITGDPDLYTSATSPYPNQTNYDRRSIHFGQDSVTYNPAPPGNYYIAVYAWRNSTFTILSTTTCTSNGSTVYTYLVDGQPLQGSLLSGQTGYYRFDLNNHHSDITISVTRRYGDPDLFIRNDGLKPSTSSYIWSSTYFGEDLITITRDDPHACQHSPDGSDVCTYLIAVYAASDTAFAVSVRTAEAILTLQDGVPVREDLTANEYEYFRLPVDTFPYTFTVTLTDLGRGDPDIFISNSVLYPNATAFTWASRRLGGDSITIPSSDPRACQPNPSAPGGGNRCVYYIGVFAATNTTFTISASFDTQTQLVDGVPQIGHVGTGAFQYYYTQVVNGHGDLTVTLTTTSGRSNLYISTSRWPESDPSSYTWSSSWYGSVHTITIPEWDANACKDTNCHYYIGVYGVRESDYTIVGATTDATVPLRNGQAQQGQVETGKWAYFSFRVDSPGFDMSIAVTPITGDPDLYVSTQTARPNQTNYERKATRFGFDVIDYLNAPVAIYYIGVNAYTNSSFTIAATLFSRSDNDTANVIRLTDGQPQQGSMAKGHWRYYVFDLSETTHADISFTLTNNFGDGDIYVSNDGQLPTRSRYNWSSSDGQNDIVSISRPKAGTYYIGVYAYTSCAFSLIGSTTEVTTQLQDSVPVLGNLEAHQYEYFVLAVDSPKDFTISVTALSGDPDLYVSTHVERPNTTNFDWSALAYRGDSITIPHTDPRFCQCRYYIAVYSFTAASYIITATFQNTTLLQDGVPQNGAVPRHAFRYYRFTVLDGHSDITLSVTPLNGNPQLYVSKSELPTTDRWDWRAISWFSGAQLVIRSTDPKFCFGNQCTYYIGVYGGEASNYSLIATSSHSQVVLQDGIPRREWVDTHSWEYFTFVVSTPGVDMTITVTAITGDPDLFVSNVYEYPNSTNTPPEWQSRAYGNDAVVIPAASSGQWYIGVYAFLNSTFVITASTSNPNDTQHEITLINGVPQNGVIVQGSYRYYHFWLTDVTAQLTFSVTRLAGDPDLYVGMGEEFPTKDRYTWSASSFGQDLITIPNPSLGEYTIGVYGFTTASYSLVASTSDAIVSLLDGVPFREDLISGTYEYFLLPVDRTDMDLTVTVTSFNGDPDLFISASDPHPSVTSYDYAARSFREDSITIPATRLQLGTYYVSVLAFSNCTFTVLASFSRQSRLQDGTPQAGSVTNEQSRYYWFDVSSDHVDVTFTVTPYSGSAYLYVSTTTEPDRRDPTSYQFSSTRYMSTQTVVVRADNAHFCANCRYFVMVYGASPSNYSLVASTSRATVTLQDGVAQRDHADSHQYAYFAFTLTNPKSALSFLITPISGDPDLYVSTVNPRPNQTSYQWRSMAFGADAVTVDFTDPNFRTATYYVGVYAWLNSTFTIMATVTDLSGATNSSVDVLLVDGVPQASIIPSRNDIRYFTFNVQDRHQDVSIIVTPRYGDPDLYVRNDGQRPRPDFYQWSSREWGRDAVSIPNSCSGCTYTIAVVAYTRTLFSIVAASSDGITELESGVPMFESLSQGQYEYFSFRVDRNDDELVVSATLLTSGTGGDPDLFISDSDDNMYPNATHYKYRSNNLGNDVFRLANPKLGTYYIGVLGYRNSTFILTATLGATTLIRDDPHDDRLFYAQSRLYNFHMDDETASKDLVLSLSITDNGRAAMYVARRDYAVHPGPDRYQWVSTNATYSGGVRNTITIEPHAPACSNCTYMINVVNQGTGPVSYSLTAVYGDSTQTLVAGKPASASVETGAYRYFRAFVDQGDRDVVIQATTFTGDVQIFVHTSEPRPSATKYIFKSDPGSHRVNISHTDPRFVTGSFYYIAVLGVSPSRFTISAATHSVVLLMGSPSTITLAGPNVGAFVSLAVSFPSLSEASSIQMSLRSVANAVRSSMTGSGQIYRLFLSTDDNYPEPGPDTPSSSVASWVVEEGDEVTISKALPIFCYDCIYYFGIYGTSGSSVLVTANTGDGYEVLIDTDGTGAKAAGVAAANSFRYFETYAPSTANLTILLSPCSGQSDLYISRDTYYPTLSDYTWKSALDNQIEMVEIPHKLAGTALYVGVYARDANADFELEAFEASQRQSIYPGNEGQLELSSAAPNTISLAFQKATSASYGGRLEYKVYFVEDRNRPVMYSVCGAEKAVPAASVPLIDEDADKDGILRLTIKEEVQGRVTYLVNVVAKDPAGNKVVYTFGRVKTLGADDIPGGGSSGNLKLILGIAIPLFLLLVALVIYLLCRNRKLTQELQIEMHDVPKAVLRKAVRGPPGAATDENRPNKDSQRYARLLTDDEEEEEVAGDQYKPPGGEFTSEL